jgi:hypothetical protein
LHLSPGLGWSANYELNYGHYEGFGESGYHFVECGGNHEGYGCLDHVLFESEPPIVGQFTFDFCFNLFPVKEISFSVQCVIH